MPRTTATTKANGAPPKVKLAKRPAMPQNDMPVLTLEKVLPIAQTLWDNFAGESASPQDVAVSIGVSPTSSSWRLMTGASIGYGLTEGGYNSKEIRLTELGRRIAAPQEEGEQDAALVEAAKRPSIPAKFIDKYDRKKLPTNAMGANVLASMGCSKERAAQDFEVLVQNAKFAGLLLQTKTGPLVVSEPRLGRVTASDTLPTTQDEVVEDESKEFPEATTQQSTRTRLQAVPANATKVFISHGSDHQMVEQLKKAIRIAKLEPIVSVERETTAKPVPDKVFGDMRSCFAGIIHVSHEGTWTDETGTKITRLNENVLIEIGAAIALYGKNVILLVDKSVKLPSNLQGLYRSEYEGKELSADALFKLLEAISAFNPAQSA